MTASPEAKLQIRSDELALRKIQPVVQDGALGFEVARETVPLQFELDSQILKERVMATLDADFEQDAKVYANISAPIQFDPLGKPILSAAKGLSLDAKLTRAPLAALLTWSPQIDDPLGVVDGEVSASGSVLEPKVSGSLTVRDAALTVVPLGQRLRDIEADLEFEGKSIKIVGARATDDDGEASIDGNVELEKLVPKSMSFQAQVEQFPYRAEGSIAARLTGGIQLDADFQQNELRGDVVFKDLNVEIPYSGRDPLSLEAHPDIYYENVEEREPLPVDPYRVKLHVDATDPIWIRSSEFQARVVADLNTTYEDPDFRVSGEAKIQRGFYDMLGKRFDVRNGTLRFDGGRKLDPEIDIVAVHELTSGSGDTVSVQVLGRLSSLSIRFSSTVQNEGGGALAESEVVALLLGTSRRDSGTQQNSAEQQTADFVAGLASSLLTLSLREQIGDAIPSISISFSSSQARFGANFDPLIPDAIKDVVQGVYVEGFLNTGSSGTSATDSARSGGGFLVELQFPNSIFTNLTGSGDSWRAQVVWEP